MASRIVLIGGTAVFGAVLSACGAVSTVSPPQLTNNLATVAEGGGGQVWAEATSFQHGQIIAGAAPSAVVLGTPKGTSTGAGIVLSEAAGEAWAGEVAHGTLALSAVYTGAIGQWTPQVLSVEIPGYPGAIAATGAGAAYAVVGGAGGGTKSQELVRLARGGAESSVVLGTRAAISLAASVGCAGVELRSVAVVFGDPMVLGSCADAAKAVVIDVAGHSARVADAPAGYSYAGFSGLVVSRGAARFAAVVEKASGHWAWIIGPGPFRPAPLEFRPTIGPSVAAAPDGALWLLIPGGSAGSVIRVVAGRSGAHYAAPPNAQGIGAASSAGALVVAGGRSSNLLALYQLRGPRFVRVRAVAVPAGD